MSDNEAITSTCDVYIPAAVRQDELDKKIGAARQSVDEAEDSVDLDLSPTTIGAVSRLIKAHIELALLERGS